MTKIVKNANLSILLVLGLVAFFRGIFFLDPDFGWHLRLGQFILSHGIPATDPFSYTMPSYSFIDHEWLTNVLINLVYNVAGIYWLSLIFAVLFILALFIAIPKKFKRFSFFPLLLAGSLMFDFVGIRTQIITVFFLSILLRIIFDEDLWEKWKYLLPLIFIPWVNLHGGFAIGIALLFVFLLAKSIEKRKFNYGCLRVFLFSLILTFLNPYGPRIWWEVWMQVSDSSLRWSIQEWMPAFLHPGPAMISLFALSLAFVFIYRKKINFSKIIIYLFLMLMAISSIRHVLLWALSAILITAEALFFFKREVGSNKESLKRLNKVKKVLVVILLLIFLLQAWMTLADAFNFREQQLYPVQAVKFLSRQNFQGNLFTDYNFAGYVLWKLPNKKDFIDGRMPSWRRNGVYPNESNYAFKDYQKMISDENFTKKMFQKYNIQYVLWAVEQVSQEKQPALAVKIDNFLNRFVNLDSGTSSKSADEVLTKLGLKKIYDDHRFAIYKR